MSEKRAKPSVPAVKENPAVREALEESRKPRIPSPLKESPIGTTIGL